MRMVVIALGVNDLYIPGTFCGSMDELPSVDDLMSGYAQLAGLLDDRTEAVWCSLTPFVATCGEEGRRGHLRTEANDLLEVWAAGRGERFVSFEDALAPNGRQDERLFEPDLLHPNDRGGAAMFARMRPMLDV